MSNSFAKFIIWALFFIGLGGAIACWVIYFTENHWLQVVWWLCHLVAMITGGILFRGRDFPAGGRWQVRLDDLLAATFLVALQLATYKLILPRYFASVGLTMSFGIGVFSIVGALFASRQKIERHPLRLLYSAGFAARVAGFISAGGLITLVSIQSRGVINYLLFIWTEDIWPVALLRVSLAHLPIGLLLLAVFLKARRLTLAPFPALPTESKPSAP